MGLTSSTPFFCWVAILSISKPWPEKYLIYNEKTHFNNEKKKDKFDQKI